MIVSLSDGYVLYFNGRWTDWNGSGGWGSGACHQRNSRIGDGVPATEVGPLIMRRITN